MKRTATIIGFALLCSHSQAQTNLNSGFYSPPAKDQVCVPPHKHIEIEKKLKTSREALVLEGKLPAVKSGVTPSFIWPLAMNNGLNDYGYYSTTNFVDHNSSYPNQLQDYNCGNKTYDTNDGYNHAGIDICLWPFEWYKKNNDQVKIIAAAAGTIISKDDGHPDTNCDFNGGGDWNAVYIEHSDGSVAWYGHMKNGSLTTKSVGQTVAAGEYLGIVGSSGYSTAPHLHFEVYDANNNLVDPYSGSCNSLNSTSWWASQKPYDDTGINALRTHSAPPVFPTCPQEETRNEQTYFCSGQDVYFAIYYRDQLAGQSSVHKVYQPDNSIWQQWTEPNTTYYNSSYWYWYYTLPSNAQAGTWKFEVLYNGQTYQHFFYVNASPTVTASGMTLTTSVAGATYQWINCDNGNSPIGGATSQSYTASVAGSYAVIVTQNGCASTSACYNMNSVGITEDAAQKTVLVYPNPSTGKFIFDLKSISTNENTSICIYDTRGQKIYESDKSAVKNSGTIDISDYSDGIYIMKVVSANSTETLKIIKQ